VRVCVQDSLGGQTVRESTHTVALSGPESIELSGSISIEHSEDGGGPAAAAVGKRKLPAAAPAGRPPPPARRMDSMSLSGSIAFSEEEEPRARAPTGGGGSDASFSLDGSSIDITGSTEIEHDPQPQARPGGRPPARAGGRPPPPPRAARGARASSSIELSSDLSGSIDMDEPAAAPPSRGRPGSAAAGRTSSPHPAPPLHVDNTPSISGAGARLPQPS
jgi:hypothetical protein